jgi:sensor histidine kinase YesM
MLLQPFLENAIVHGLGPRNGAGKIRIHVSKHQDILVFVIEDDGVGRNERAGGLITSPERKSHGLDITRQRLQLYDLQNNTVSELETEDLNQTDGTPSGTRVTLRLGIGRHA